MNRMPVLVLAAALIAAPLAAPAPAGAVLVPKWTAAARNGHFLGAPWGDGIDRSLVDTAGGIRVLNLRTGALEGSLPLKYGTVPNLEGVSLIDPNGNGSLRLLVAGRMSAGQAWYVGVFALAAPGQFDFAWEVSPVTFVDVWPSRVTGPADEVALVGLSGSGDRYVTLFDGHGGSILWDQQASSVPPHVTLVENDETGDGIADWLMEVRASVGSPIETRLFGIAPGVSTPPVDGVQPALALGGNAPNPFVGDTRIAFALPRAGEVEVTVFDPAGRRVRTLVRGPREAGPHHATWDGRDDAGRTVPAGVYLVEVRSGDERQARRMIRLR
jgi:hypothetical protein